MYFGTQTQDRILIKAQDSLVHLAFADNWTVDEKTRMGHYGFLGFAHISACVKLTSEHSEWLSCIRY